MVAEAVGTLETARIVNQVEASIIRIAVVRAEFDFVDQVDFQSRTTHLLLKEVEACHQIIGLGLELTELG